jgi:hypothetical protein
MDSLERPSMTVLTALLPISLLAQVPSLNYPATYVVNSTVQARRVISFTTASGTTAIIPHIGSGPANGITLTGGATGLSVPIVSYGNTICEFDGVATLGNIAGINGDRCHDTGQTSLDNISNLLGVMGYILIANPTICANCYSVAIVGPLEVGRMLITIPAGLITLILSGTCPSGFSEVSALNGKTLIGTLAANGNVGTTGGADTITPAGTVAAPVFIGAALSTHSHTISGGTGAISAGTPAGTNAASATTGNCAATNIAAGTGATTACKAVAPNLAVTAQVFTGSAMPTHLHGTGTLGTANVSAGTPAGTNSAPAFTGTNFDNRSAFVRVIFCSKD